MKISTKITPYTSFAKWLAKRIQTNRSYFIRTFDIDHWPPGKFIEYKGRLYYPIKLEWPEKRDYGVLYTKLIGTTRKLQSGSSTNIQVLGKNIIKLSISHELKNKSQRKQKQPKQLAIKKLIFK